MTLLLVLLVIIGSFVIVTAVLVGASYGFGMFLYNREAPKPDRGDTDSCAQCNADRAWYEAMPPLKQNAVTAWWWVNRLTWASKGCK